MRIVDGEIVLDTDTLVVERQSGESRVIDESMEVVEETSLTRKVNSNTYGKRKPSSRWDKLETVTFYEVSTPISFLFLRMANKLFLYSIYHNLVRISK